MTYIYNTVYNDDIVRHTHSTSGLCMGDICHKVDGKLVHANSLFAALDGRGGGGDVGKTQISIEIQRAIPRKSPTSATAPSWIKVP